MGTFWQVPDTFHGKSCHTYEAKTLDAMGTALSKDLHSKTQDIQSVCKRIDAEATARGLAESRYMRVMEEENNSMLHDLRRRDSHVHMLSDSNLRLTKDNQTLRQQNDQLYEQMLRQQEDYQARLKKANDYNQSVLGTQMMSALEDIFKMRMAEKEQGGLMPALIKELSNTSLSHHSLANEDSSVVGEYTGPEDSRILFRDDALDIARSLELSIAGARDVEMPLFNNTFTPTIVGKLHAWSTKASSQVLWIIGEPDYKLPSNMHAAAAAMICTVEKLEIKFISYFCEILKNATNRREEKGLIDLVYDLILQLLELLPPMINTDEMSITRDRIQQLDGTMTTWYEPLDLLEDLLKYHSWPLLLCVIDRLTSLDFGLGRSRCEEFVDVLLLKHYETINTIFKILLTSAGNTGKDTGMGRQIPMLNQVYPDRFREIPLELTRESSDCQDAVDGSQSEH